MGPESRRILVATVLSVGILFAWQALFPAPKPAPGGQGAAPAGTATPPAGAPAAAVEATPAAPAPAPVPVPEAPEEIVTLAGNGFEVELSSRGGTLAHLRLTEEKFRHGEGGDSAPIDLVRVADAQARPLGVTASPSLGGGADPLLDPAAWGSMRIVARDEKSVTFEGRAGVLGVRKSYRVTGKPYELGLELQLSGAPGAGTASLVYTGFMPPQTGSGGIFSGPPLDFLRPVCRTGDKTERFDVTGSDVKKAFDGAPAWLGMDRHYFLGALIPAEPVGRCVMVKGGEQGSAAAILEIPVDPAGRTVSFTIFAGPKQLDLLQSYGRGFETAIDYGPVTNLFAIFAQGLLRVMRWFHPFVHNWGVAIILLTLLVKVVLFPLTLKSMQSMAGMRKLQPELEKLKAKLGDDKEAFARAQFDLMRQHKVNPAGGCLPMLLQMPIWFALYAALQTSVELYREPFLWIADLTVKDPFFILPIAMGLTSFIMQKVSPQPADATQAKMMLYFFPGFFTVMMLFVPAGLTLYIFVNNLLSIVQQQMVNRMQEKASAAA